MHVMPIRDHLAKLSPAVTMILLAVFMTPAVTGFTALTFIALYQVDSPARTLFLAQHSPGRYNERDVFTRFLKQSQIPVAKNRIDRFSYIDRLSSFYHGYRHVIATVECTIENGITDFILTTTTGRKFLFDNGKITPLESTGTKADSSLFQALVTRQKEGPVKGCLYPRAYDYSFFNDIYGSKSSEVMPRLEMVSFRTYSVPFSKKNRAATGLQRVFDTIETISASDKEVQQWISGIRSVSTVSYRPIANAKRPSLHSYAIAVDIRVSPPSSGEYWYWDRQKGKWWSDTSTKKAVPVTIVTIFRDNGFAWGGDWFFYDTMHFEYRPELTRRTWVNDGYPK
jgi:hypothetical protein